MSFLSPFTGMFGGLSSTFLYILYLLPVVLIIIAIVVFIRNKMIYRYLVRIFRTRENGKVLEANYKGGYIGRKNSAPFFRIKTGRWWWQYTDLIETPKPEYMDEQNRVYYKQIDVNTYIQLKRNFGKGEVNYTPVESDVKYGAILSVQRVKEVLRTEPAWKKILPYATLIILAIVFIVSYAMLMNRCSGGG